MNYDLARSQFNLIARLDVGDPMPEDAMLTLQVELYRWQQNRFGGCTDWQMVLGMIEEAGEFDEATDSDLRYDAVGDVLVFGCQLLTLKRCALNIAIADADHSKKPARSLASAMGHLAKVTLKGNQKIRGLADPELYRRALYEATVTMFATVRGHRYVSLAEVISSVARQVVLKRAKGHNAIPS